MNYKIITWVLAAIIGTFLGLVIVGLIFDDEPDYNPTTSDLSSTERDNMAQMRQGFMEGCNSDGDDYSYCSCVWTEISQDSTSSELYDMASQVEAGNWPDKFTNAVEYCVFGTNPV